MTTTSTEKIITITRDPMFDKTKVAVVFKAKSADADEWDVYFRTKHIGTVGRYTGTLDRPAGRLRIQGVERTLWSSRTPGSSYTAWGIVSRAEAIRDLLRTARA